MTKHTTGDAFTEYKYTGRKLLKFLAALLSACVVLCGCRPTSSLISATGDASVISQEDGKLKIVYCVNGTVYTTSYYDEGALVELPENPEVDGYTFTGWDTEIPSVMPSSDLTVNALLEKNSYTVTYMLDGEKYAEKHYDYQDTIENIIPEYNQETYIFSGWTNMTSEMPASDLTVYGYLYNLKDVNKVDLSALSHGEILTLSEGGQYLLTGKADNAQILIDGGSDDFTIILSNASLTYLGEGAAIQCIKADNLNLLLMSGTENTVSDSSSNTENGAISVKSADLTVNGSGQLNVNSFSSGIYNTKDMTVESGNINIVSSCHGIVVKNSLTVTGGTITVQSESDGFKAKGDEDGSSELSIEAGTGNISLSGSAVSITSGGDGIQAEGCVDITGGNIKVVSSQDGIQGTGGVSFAGASADITSGGGTGGTTVYDESGDEISTKGIKSDREIKIVSGNVTINSLENSVKSDTQITVSGGTLNLSSATSTVKADDGTESNTGVIVIAGGTITINSGKNGIYGTDSVSISGGIINVTTTGSETDNSSSAVSGTSSQTGYSSGGTGKTGGFGGGGFKGENSNISIKSKGIKAGNSLVISGGTVNVSSTGHAIQSDGSLTVESNPIITVDAYYSGANSKGLKAETDLNITGGTIKILRSYEGIESKANITISGGSIELEASDDGLNASMLITIESGYIFINASGDGIDSNGNIIVTGGTTIVAGPTSDGNGALDCGDGNNYVSVTGGILLAYGSSGMAEYPSSSYSTQNTIGYAVSMSSGTIFSLRDSSGNDIFTFEALKSAQNVCLSTPDIKTGETYTVYTGGNCTGEKLNGVYSGGSYDGGTSAGSLTISSTLTANTSTGIFGGMGGGMAPGGRR